MKTWQFTEAGASPTENDVAEPVARTGEVLIDIKASGRCHSDVSYLDGTIKGLPFTPIALGHEIAGVIVDVGPGVARFTPGQRVAIPANL